MTFFASSENDASFRPVGCCYLGPSTQSILIIIQSWRGMWSVGIRVASQTWTNYGDTDQKEKPISGCLEIGSSQSGKGGGATGKWFGRIWEDACTQITLQGYDKRDMVGLVGL